MVFGKPVDQADRDKWPLGTRALTQQLQPVVDQLKRGDAPPEEVRFALDGADHRTVSCRASVLLRDGAPAGGVLVLRELAS